MAARRSIFQGSGGGMGGGWKGGLRGDNPFMWSVPFGRVFGITLRISVIYIVWMVLELLTTRDFQFKLTYVGTLFVLVLLHELGHCLACRKVGGEADDILMWMLGGLAFCRPPHNWKAHLITTIGGPLVNVLLIPVFAGTMIALGAPVKAMIFNPWGGGVTEAWRTAVNGMGAGVPDWLGTLLFCAYMTNLALLLFNILLPMYPMDGGRLVQNILWRWLGYSRSMMISTTVGLVAAVFVGLFAATVQSWMLLCLALMCGFSCYQMRQQLRFLAASGAGFGEDDTGENWKYGGQVVRQSGRDRRREAKAEKAAETARKQAESNNAELDRILAKIKEKGMASLSRSEQAFLRQSSERSRGG
ncbi:MAG: hypothetical protein QM783_10520 [Phycisphaerales bacterium]